MENEFKFDDFGARGTSTPESALIAGMYVCITIPS